MAHGWTPAVALQTEPHLAQGACTRSGNNVFLDGLATGLTSIAETEKLAASSSDRQYVLPTAGRPLDRIFPRRPPRVQDT